EVRRGPDGPAPGRSGEDEGRSAKRPRDRLRGGEARADAGGAQASDDHTHQSEGDGDAGRSVRAGSQSEGEAAERARHGAGGRPAGAGRGPSLARETERVPKAQGNKEPGGREATRLAEEWHGPGTGHVPPRVAEERAGGLVAGAPAQTPQCLGGAQGVESLGRFPSSFPVLLREQLL